MKNEENQKYIKWGITAIAVVGASLLLFFIMFRMQSISQIFSSVITILNPFLYGAVIAYLLAPLCEKLETTFGNWFQGKKPKLAEGLSVLISILLAVLVLFAVFLLIIPQVWKSVTGIAEVLPDQLNNANAKINELLQKQPQILEWWNSYYKQIVDQFETWWKGGFFTQVQTIITSLATRVAGVFTVLKNLLLGLIISVYLLAKRKQFSAQAKLLIRGMFNDKWVRMIEREIRFADKMFNGFFMGKLLDSAIIGMICFIGCVIMQFSSSALIAVVVGITNIIPFFGPLIGAVPCALLLLLENPMHCLMFVIFIIVLQQVDGNLIGPKILGDSTGLSSFWVMFAILLFGGLWGILGMIVGVPLFAIIYDIIRHLIYSGLKKHNQGELIQVYLKEWHPELSETPAPEPSPEPATTESNTPETTDIDND